MAFLIIVWLVVFIPAGFALAYIERRVNNASPRYLKVVRTIIVASIPVFGMLAAAGAEASAAALAPVNSSPAKSAAQHGGFAGVSCLSATDCTAVGAGPTWLAEHWNGKKWAAEPTPAGDAKLNAVSCTSDTACTAVGQVHSGAKEYPIELTLAERWNGKKWAVEPTPKLNGTVVEAYLEGVSCASATACTAVGTYTLKGKQPSLLAENWNGKKWVIESVPEPKKTFAADPFGLTAVSCSAAASCVAVGSYISSATGGPFALVEGWNGKKWAYALPPNPKGACTGTPKPGCTSDSEFSGVSCVSANACTAVGQYVPLILGDYLGNMLAEKWNGKTWTIESTPGPSSKGATYLQVTGVSCASAKACAAVGYYDRSGANVTLAENWNGKKWAIEPTPNTSTATEGSLLAGVACASAKACTAVGDQHSTDIETLAESWNGEKWAVEP